MAEPFITLNAQPGEILTRADVNRLDANSANAAQVNWGSGIGGPYDLTQGKFDDLFGWARATLNAPGQGSIRRTGLAIPIGASTYTISWDHETASVAPIEYRLQVFTSAGNVATTNISLPTGKRRLSFQVVLGTGEIEQLWVESRTGGSTGDWFEVSKFNLELDTTPGDWVPSFRVVDNLDLRWRIKVAALATGLEQNVLDCRNGNFGFQIFLHNNTASVWFVRYGAGVSARSGSISGLGATQAGIYQDCRLTWVAGVVEAFIDGNLEGGTDFANADPAQYNGQPVRIGANLGADIEFCEVRDGIDGVVVYRLDASDVLAAVT